MTGGTDEQDKEAKVKEFLEKARRGVLKHVDQNGGTMSLGEVHDYSLKKYFIQHQRFSQLMETLVDEELVDYDHETQVATITEKGKEFIK